MVALVKGAEVAEDAEDVVTTQSPASCDHAHRSSSSLHVPVTLSLTPYLDTFAKIEQRWYFAERKLIVDWSETRSLTAPTAD